LSREDKRGIGAGVMHRRLVLLQPSGGSMKSLCAENQAVGDTRTRGRVLIVHPSSSERSRIRQALDGANCEVMEATDGTQAFMMVLSCEIDLAITELAMQPGTGLDFISALSILPTHAVRPEVIVWSDLVGTTGADRDLQHVRVAARLAPAAGIDRLLAAVDAVLDDPLDFVLSR
jgi:CheY-like chemotaxis protein